MRIDKIHWGDVRRIDFKVQGTGKLYVNRHQKENGYCHISKEDRNPIRMAVYHIPGTRRHGYPVAQIHARVRQSVRYSGTTMLQIDQYLHLAGVKGYAVLTGEAEAYRSFMALYRKWTAEFSVFWVRNIFSSSQIYDIIQNTGNGGIGDRHSGHCVVGIDYISDRLGEGEKHTGYGDSGTHLERDSGIYEVVESTVNLNDPYTYQQFLSAELP